MTSFPPADRPPPNDPTTGTAPDLAALRRRLESGGGRRFWRSLEDLAETDDFRRFVEAEFPAVLELSETSRRTFLRLMAAPMMLGGLAACGDMPDEKALPYVNQPEMLVPGKPLYFATAALFEGYAQPVLAETHVGRPTRLEGNPDHPMIGAGSTDAFAQASILELYDPDRSRAITFLGRIATWDAFQGVVVALRERLGENSGGDFRILTETVTSPTLRRQLDDLQRAFPRARVHSFEPVGVALRHQGTRRAFGRPLDVHYRLENAAVVVSLEDDIFGPGPSQVRHAAQWSQRRRDHQQAGNLTRLHVAESTPTLTGALAGATLSVASQRLPVLLAALAGKLGEAGEGTPAAALTPRELSWVSTAADELAAHRGSGLLAVGAHLPAEAQARAHAINHALGNAGATVVYSDPVGLAATDDAGALPALAEAMAAGEVETLVILGANPVYTAPADLDFANRLDRVGLRIHAGIYYDETASNCHWHIPLTHPLESWSDARAVDGTASILQPTVKPLFGGTSVHELLATLLGRLNATAYELVRETWDARLGGEEAGWRQVLSDGFVANSAVATETPAPQVAAEPPATDATDATDAGAASGLEAVFRPDPCVWDGRLGNVAWLQELPKPLTKLTWENVLAVSARLAEELGLGTGDEAELTVNDRSVRGPVWIMPGQAERTVTVFLGYGRSRAGRVGNDAGYNAYAVRTAAEPWTVQDAALRRTGERLRLATTQNHATMAGGDFVRTVSVAEARTAHPDEPPLPTFYPQWDDPKYAWAMSIDLDLCIGCNACVLACQAENNIPVVGKEQVEAGREMHWIRVDRYYEGGLDQPDRTLFQPLPCMHCEKAPCEVGCPVNATVHGPEGLNEMVYNRCVGTRTCASYCPYKVRRFNFFEFGATDSPSIQAQRNPNVTVRARGVMEKCTYCVQRISAARIEAQKQGRAIRDGEVVTACQSACPTQAIVFGNQADPDSAVSRRQQSPRRYALLRELNTRPRTTYQARILNDASDEEA
ncbi:MAG: TAT-variant-translocated molybdopterin oxidoreductase [Rhodospirillales bacterium]|nr:TAT-variant-translocated molybdopterin oxidoreductase [Rhodospirillales bacterium]